MNVQRKTSSSRVSGVVSLITKYILHEPSYQSSIQKTLDLLVRVTNVSRAYVFDIDEDDTGNLIGEHLFESCNVGITPQIDNPDLKKVPVHPVFSRWYEMFLDQKYLMGDVESFPADEQVLLRSQGIQSTLAMPIVNNHVVIGFIGFDEVNRSRTWSKRELVLLRQASVLLGTLLIRRRHEISLGKQSRFAMDLYNNMADGVVYHDETGRIIRANPAASTILGLTEDQLLGRTSIHPEWRAVKFDKTPYPGNEHPAMVSLESGEPVLGKIMGVYHPISGEYRWISINAIPQFSPKRLPSDKPDRVFAIFRDITDQFRLYDSLRQSHSQFTAYVDKLPIGVWFRDEKYRLIFVNDFLAELFGISKEEFFEDNAERHMEFVHTDDRALVKTQQEEHIKSKLDVEFEYRLITTDANEHWVKVRLTYMQLPGTQDTVVSAGFMTDITVEKNRYEALRKAKVMADEFSSLKSNIISTISHEFRTPITGIIGFASLLRDQLKEPVHLEYINIIDNSATRLYNTLESILNYSILESGTQEVRVGEFDVELALHLKLREIEIRCEENGLYLQTAFPQDLIVHTDRNIFSAIVGELLENAVKFTKSGGIRLLVHRNKTHISVEVHDTGIGIANPSKAFVFHPFRQGSEGLSRGYEGIGMGLAILSKRVTLLHGTIRCTRNEHGGSSFYLSIPLTNPETPLLNPLSVIKRERDINILYVEDNPILQMMMKRMLNGYMLDLTQDTQEALELANEREYNVFVLDINLNSGIDGIELCRIIRSMPQYKNALIITVTAYSYDQLSEHINPTMFNHYVGKPFSDTQLKKIINTHFNI